MRSKFIILFYMRYIKEKEKGNIKLNFVYLILYVVK